jgi:hypothetical protein
MSESEINVEKSSKNVEPTKKWKVIKNLNMNVTTWTKFFSLVDDKANIEIFFILFICK